MSDTPQILTITDLRAKLFEAIDGVRTGTLDVEKAKVISALGHVIVHSSKVEVEYMRATERVTGSGFMEAPAAPRAGSLGDGTTPGDSGIARIARHVLR